MLVIAVDSGDRPSPPIVGVFAVNDDRLSCLVALAVIVVVVVVLDVLVATVVIIRSLRAFRRPGVLGKWCRWGVGLKCRWVGGSVEPGSSRKQIRRWRANAGRRCGRGLAIVFGISNVSFLRLWGSWVVTLGLPGVTLGSQGMTLDSLGVTLSTPGVTLGNRGIVFKPGGSPKRFLPIGIGHSELIFEASGSNLKAFWGRFRISLGRLFKRVSH